MNIEVHLIQMFQDKDFQDNGFYDNTDAKIFI